MTSSSSFIEPFEFEEIDEEEEPTSWAAIQAGEVKYQSMKLLTLANRVSAPHTTTNINNNDNNNNKGNSGGDDGASPRDVNQENRNVNAPAAPLAVKRAVPDPLALLPRKITTANTIDSPDFDPAIFLQEFHADTSYEDLLRGSKHLSRSLRSEEEQIKQLVANNFDKFVQSKDTIDAVVAQINANESRAGTLGDTLLKGAGSGTDPAAARTLDDDDASESADGGTATLTAIYGALTREAGDLYKPLLSKLTEASRLKSLLALIDRFQFLFLLPARVRQNISLNEKEKVLRDYEKARRLVRSSNIELFKKIFVEIHAQIIAFAQLLYDDLRAADLNTQRDEIERLIKLIDEFNSIILASDGGDDMTQSESFADLPRDIGRPPATVYARRRFAVLRRHIESASLATLCRLVLTREIEFIEQYFPLDELLRAYAAKHHVDDELAEPRASSSRRATAATATLSSRRRSRRPLSLSARRTANAGDSARNNDNTNNNNNNNNHEDDDDDAAAHDDDDSFDEFSDSSAVGGNNNSARGARSFDPVAGLFEVLDTFLRRVASCSSTASVSETRIGMLALSSLVFALRHRIYAHPTHSTATAAAAAAATTTTVAASTTSQNHSESVGASPDVDIDNNHTTQSGATAANLLHLVPPTPPPLHLASNLPTRKSISTRSRRRGTTTASIMSQQQQQHQQQQQQQQQRVAGSAAWTGAAGRLAARAEQRLLYFAREVLGTYIEAVFDDVRERISETWSEEAGALALTARAHACQRSREARQRRFEQSLRLAPLAQESAAELGHSSAFFSMVDAPSTRGNDDVLRERLAAARRLLLSACFAPLRDASMLLSSGAVKDVRARVVGVIELLVNLLRAAALHDDTGARQLHVLRVLDYLRTKFIGELLALFYNNFAGVVVTADVASPSLAPEALFERRVPAVLLNRIKELEQVLIREYVRLQVAHVDSIVGDGLLRAGTNWFFHEARTMRVQDYAIKLLLRLVATHNQLMSRCPELLNDIMSRVVEGVFASFLNALPAIECFDMLGLLQLLIDVSFVETTLARYATTRSRRLLDTLHAQLLQAARSAGAEADLNSPVALQMKRAALARALHSCRVLFLCFAEE